MNNKIEKLETAKGCLIVAHLAITFIIGLSKFVIDGMIKKEREIARLQK